GPNGVKRSGAIGESDKEIDRALAEAEQDPQGRANANLVRQVGDYRTRLDAITREKTEVEAKLKKTEESLAAAQDGAPVVAKHSFDMGAEEWKDLAKDGTIKYQMPCIDTKGGGHAPRREKLDRLGLSPQDGETIKGA